jgi:RimJ/RimL family protein N-acetyltransferase
MLRCVGPSSPRLEYTRLDEARRDAFHALAIDEHVRHYLLDGAIVDRAWCEAEIVRSDALFASHGVGLWILSHEGDTIGFAGFRIFEEHDREPQLLYAILERHTRRGLAEEAARACIRAGRDAGLPRIVAAVDEPNVRSIALLIRLGFERDGEWPGAFGSTFRFVLS